jgi:crossover junction endodeoxyribonuclease RusA
VNVYWRYARGKVYLTEAAKQYKAAVLQCVGRRPTPIADLVLVEVDVYPPDTLDRDIDNLLKATLDALTNAGVWVDDVQVKRLVIEQLDVVKGGALMVSISKYERKR